MKIASIFPRRSRPPRALRTRPSLHPATSRLWLVDPRYVRVEPKEDLEYKVLDGAGAVLTSGTVQDQAYIDIEEPEAEHISLWLDGEVLTAHE